MEVLNLKKTFVTIIIIVALVFSSGINASAFAGSDVKVYTRASVSDVFSETPYSNIIQNIFSFSGSGYNFTPSVIYNQLNKLPSNYTNYDNYILYIDSDGYLNLFCFNDDSLVCIAGNNYQNSLFYPDSRASWYTYITTVNGGYSYMTYKIDSGTNSTWSSQGYSSADSNAYHYFYGGGILVSCNMPIYYFYELNMKNIPHSGVIEENFFSHPELLPDMTNFNDVNLPYVDGDGNIVDPTPVIESNSNHMYFQNCDLGFCEPTDIKNFTSFGGAYLYCKYTLDNWVINHINEYQLQFNVVAAIGSEQNNFSYTMRVDRNGFVTIPFSYIFQSQSSSAIPINRGFAAVVTNQKLGTDYNIAHLYSVANSNVPNFIRTLGAEYNYNLTDLGWSALKGGTLKYLCAWVSDGGTISMNNLAEWSENVAQSFNPYIFRVNVKLVSGDDVSGDYAEKFDLYAGDQSTVDTGGLVNNDPFVPDVDQDDGDLPELPQDPNSTTPSTIVYTGGTFTGNFNGVIGYDPGYRDLKADLDADPDDNFTQYLAPFKNNEVGGFVGDFLDDMPTALKSIFIGGFGVLTLLGIYRFIRRG